jgi:HEAT repeat protein
VQQQLKVSWLALVVVLGCGRSLPYQGRTVAELEQMLADPAPTVRVQGAYGLSLLGPAAAPAVPALVQALQSPDALLRMQAALALGRIGLPARDAVPHLVNALSDPEWTVRRQAALALREIGPEEGATGDALRRLQRDDPNGQVRKAAQQALAR